MPYRESCKDAVTPRASGDKKMLSVNRPLPAAAAGPADIATLRDSVRVLSEVVGQLAERVELLETSESLRAYRPVEG